VIFVRKIVFVFCLLLGIHAAFFGMITYSHADLSKLPRLESGDLIFQTHLVGQTAAILLATRSLYTHMGIIHRQGDTLTVIHAGRQVIESPLEGFIRSGWGDQFTIMRRESLTPVQRDAIVKNAQRYVGRNYNYVFHMDSEEIYCSQLPYLAFKEANVTLGTLQKISELHLDNFAVKKLFNERWKIHPSCQAKDMTSERCWKVIMEEPIITPVNIMREKNLTQIYSNYWF
jgi:Permuted papain-like amidase enzyme, YaeF/YiiX, C92 family